MGPVSTGLGEVFHYSVEFEHPDGKGAPVKDGEPGWQSDGSFLTDDGEKLQDHVSKLAYLRTVQDWVVRPQLRTTTGVADGPAGRLCEAEAGGSRMQPNWRLSVSPMPM